MSTNETASPDVPHRHEKSGGSRVPPGPSRESEFKFFRRIEDTIAGSLEFVVRYLFTTWMLTRRPQNLTSYLRAEKANLPLSPPFTYVAVASVVGSIFLREAVINVRTFGRAGELTEALQKAFLTLSFGGMFAIFPLIVATVALSALLIVLIFGRRLEEAGGTSVKLACYATGYQILIITLGSVGLTAWWLSAGDVADVVEKVVGIGSAVYLVALLASVSPWRVPVERIPFVRLATKHAAVQLFSLIFLAIIAFYAGGLSGNPYWSDVELLEKPLKIPFVTVIVGLGVYSWLSPSIILFVNFRAMGPRMSDSVGRSLAYGGLLIVTTVVLVVGGWLIRKGASEEYNQLGRALLVECGATAITLVNDTTFEVLAVVSNTTSRPVIVDSLVYFLLTASGIDSSGVAKLAARGTVTETESGRVPYLSLGIGDTE